MYAAPELRELRNFVRNRLSASLPERSSIVHTLSYSVVDLLLCAGNFILARQPARPGFPASGPERPENFLVGSLPVVSVVPGNSRESFSGTADGLVGIRDDPRELIPDDWCMGCFPLGEELGVLPGLLL
jgi:hypothetical protein